MATKPRRAPRRTQALSREVIVQAAVDLLDAEGEDALTLKALTVRLATGYGAIYHHVADRNDLLAAAVDDVVAEVVAGLSADAEPKQALRALALGLFDIIDAHPWVGSRLNREPWRPVLLDVYENVAVRLRALGVPEQSMSDAAGVLVNYIFGVAGQNAANARTRAAAGMDRAEFLADVADRWARLDPVRYPSVRRAAVQLRDHDDREQFLAGISIILAGIEAVNRTSDDSPAR